MSIINPNFTPTSNIVDGQIVDAASINNKLLPVENWVSGSLPSAPIISVSTNTSVTTNNRDIYVNNTTAGVTITLPAIPAGNVNLYFEITKLSDNKSGVTRLPVTIVCTGGDTINGLASLVIHTKFSRVLIQCNQSILGSDYKASAIHRIDGLDFCAFRSADTTYTPGGGIIQLNNDSTGNGFDTNNDFNTSTFTYTTPVKGIYNFTAGCFITGGTSTDCSLVLTAGARAYRLGHYLGATNQQLTGPANVSLDAGQAVSIAFINALTNRTILGADSLTYLTGTVIKIIQ